MSADLLREAAALMRERANATIHLRDAVTNEPLRWTPGLGGDVWDMGATPIASALDVYASEHIASWHPAVALAVADWLDSEDTHRFGPTEHAIAVATAYLGSP